MAFGAESQAQLLVAGGDRYFDDLSAAIRRGEVTQSALADIARWHSMEVVGPVPESYV
jgi:hypothetical protein